MALTNARDRQQRDGSQTDGGERMIIAWRAWRGAWRFAVPSALSRHGAALTSGWLRHPQGGAAQATQRERREPPTVRARKKQEQQWS
jgi:hypothetical protein